MDFIKYILVLVVVFVDSDAGGHEEHHDHVKLHVPEFIHHDHHTKVITIHHHHHKPKKEHHHHHHHHHHKPHIPHSLPSYHHHLKTSTRTVSKGHNSHLGQKSHHHGSRGHHSHSGQRKGHRTHNENKQKPHETPPSYDSPIINYESPSINYAPPTFKYVPSFGNDYGSYSPSVSSIPSTPHVHGLVHTVKHVKVFDSLPGVLQGSPGNKDITSSKGYEVKEQEGEDEDDIFTSVSSLAQTYPGTYDFIRSAAAEPGGNTFSDIPNLNNIQSPSDGSFGGAQPQTSYGNTDDFTIQNHPPSAPPLLSVQPLPFSDSIGFDNTDNSVTGNDANTDLLNAEGLDDDTPVTFSREAGIQHAINTGQIETIAY